MHYSRSCGLSYRGTSFIWRFEHLLTFHHWKCAGKTPSSMA